jgi:serine protease Do
MRRFLPRLILAAGTLAALACSRGSIAATPPSALAAVTPPAVRAVLPPAPAVAAAPGDRLLQPVAAPAAEVPVASLAPLVEKLRLCVVNISTVTAAKHPPPTGRRQAPPRRPHGDDFDDFFDRFFGGRPGPSPDAPDDLKGASLGSGFLLDGEGFILTNNHVVKDATDIRVRLSDGREFGAKVIGRDGLTDVALIQLLNAPRDLPTPAVLGDSDVVRQGDFVLAMGSPFGLRDTVTLGIVSAKHRAGLNPGATYDDFIQTDAAINPGNSGGPLFNLRGEVVGINTLIVSPQIGQGIGFAVPISLAKALLPQLRQKGRVTRGFLGVEVADLTPDLLVGFALKAGTKGALVQGVKPRSPAAKAGIEAGDVIVQLDGKPIDSSGALTRAAALVSPGQSATVVVLRRGAAGVEQKSLVLKAGVRPEDEAQPSGPSGEPEGGELSKEPPPTPKLGVTLQRVTRELQDQLGLEGDEGVVVTHVAPDGPADHVNLRRGDVILEVNRKPVKKPDDVAAIIAKLKENDVVLLRVRRGDQASFLTLRLGGK